MIKGDKCWIVENGLKVTSVEVVSLSGNLVLIKTENGKSLRLPRHRLFKSEEEAKGTVKEPESIQKKRTPYDYMV